jgi:hypothetical protein
MGMDPQLEAELCEAATEDLRSIHQTVVLAVETYLALRGKPRSMQIPRRCGR